MKLVSKKKSEVTVKTSEYTDLRQVMDYKRDFSMFYSGVEYEVYLDGCYNMGVRNFLMSYEYLKNKGAGQIKKYPDMHLFIDSGAYTYMSNPQYESYTVEDWEKHIKNYLNWVERNKEHIFAFAELDLQFLVGIDTVNKWRREYFEPFMLRTGVPVCFVCHEDDDTVWEKMCQRYPYVGISVATENVNQLAWYQNKLKVAEKYNSLVHGFGMTRTSILPQLPFYTVDSTSWKSGFRYGQLAVFNSKKVQLFKKEDWEVKAFPIIENYPDISFDKEKIYDYYEPEVLRVNVYAYQRAEEYIVERLKSLTYWKKARANKQNVDNLSDDFFPTVEWLDSDSTEGLKEYCAKFNVNPEFDGARSILYDITTFLNWENPKFKELHDWYDDPKQEELITKLHDLYINRIVPDKEAKIQDLIDFFKSCVSGENDKLLQLGTNFDRTVKERENYIEEDDKELVDISPEDVVAQVKDLISPNLLKDSEAPEIDELDEEIFRKAEITPIYDENHRLVKGQKLVHKPKRVYSKKFPKLACDTCYAAAKCPEYKAGYVCAYNKMFDRFDTRSMSDIIQATQGIVEYNMTRMQKAMIMETLNGTIDPTVTGLMDTNIRYMQMLKSMYENGSAEVLRQTKVVRADGTQETTTSITNPQGGGIMEKLLSSIVQPQDTTTPPTGEVVDIPPQETAE